jgi:hypothetical protein
MKKSIVAGAALVAGIAIAAPMLALSATENDFRTSQAAPAQPGMPGTGGMAEHGGAMGHHHWMREMMMHRMAQLTPQQRCEERLARRAGRAAYVATKLNLTPEQRPLWEKLRSQMQASADKQHQLCASLKPANEGAQQTVLDRVNRREQFLSARLQALKETRPALELLYQALTPDQKAIIDHPFKRG